MIVTRNGDRRRTSQLDQALSSLGGGKRGERLAGRKKAWVKGRPDTIEFQVRGVGGGGRGWAFPPISWQEDQTLSRDLLGVGVKRGTKLRPQMDHAELSGTAGQGRNSRSALSLLKNRGGGGRKREGARKRLKKIPNPNAK